MPNTLTIGQVAAQAGVRHDTVRYYERRGLIPLAARRASGYRDFPADTVQRIRFIKRAQELGFTLDEIVQLLRLRDRRDAQCADVMHVAEDKIHLIERKIADLEAMRAAIDNLLSSCRGEAPIVDCPIIENLERAAANGKRRGTNRTRRP